MAAPHHRQPPWQRLLGLCVAALLAQGCATSAPHHKRYCEESGYCSSGHTKGYIGMLDSGAEFKAALEATAFKKEVILSTHDRLDYTAQFLHRWRKVGYSHILMVMDNVGQCHKVADVLEPWRHEHGNISCGAYITTDEKGERYKSGFRFMKNPSGFAAWWRKQYTAGRAVALGYNVMLVDSDTLPLGDWYGRIKNSPLKNYHMLAQAESFAWINSGWSYMQNIPPGSAVVWLWFESLHRAVQMSENCSHLHQLTAYDKDEGYDMWDQEYLTDAMLSAVAGRPVFYHLLHAVQKGSEDTVWQKLGIARKEFHKRIEDMAFSKFHWETHTMEGPGAQNVCDKWPCSAREDKDGKANFTILTAKLKMPYSGGQYPPEMGGNPASPTPGPFTLAYRQSWKDLGVQLPPDVDDPAAAEAARTQPEMLFGLMDVQNPRDGYYKGTWLTGTWQNIGRLGYWHSHLNPPVSPAGSHVVVSLPSNNGMHKDYVFKVAGQYDWTVAARAWGSLDTAMYTNHQRHEGVYINLTRVVAYAPDVVSRNWKLTKQQYVRTLNEIAKVAMIFNATVAWPGMSCDSEWVMDEYFKDVPRPFNHSIPWSYFKTRYVVLPFGDSLQDLQCEWPLMFWHMPCVLGDHPRTRALTSIEFDALLKHGVHADWRKPTPASTIKLKGGGDSPVPPPLSAEVTKVTQAELLQLNSDMLAKHPPHARVIWLDRLVEVEGMSGEPDELYKDWESKCLALHYEHPKEECCEKEWIRPY